MSHFFTVVQLCSFMVLCGGIVRGDLKDSFFGENQESLLRMEESFADAQVKYAMELEANIVVDVEVFRKGKLFRTEFMSGSRLQVLCKSENSWFACTRESDTDRWSLGISSDSEEEMPPSFLECEKLFAPHYAVFGIPLRELVSAPGFKLVSHAEVVGDEGEKLLKLEFDSIPVLKVGTKRTIVTVDPSKGGRIVSAKLGRQDGKDFSFIVTYQGGSELPEQVEIRFDGRPYRKVRYTQWSLDEVPSEPFFLEYYGFGKPKNSSSIVVYIFFAGIFFLGFLLIWRVRSRSKVA